MHVNRWTVVSAVTMVLALGSLLTSGCNHDNSDAGTATTAPPPAANAKPLKAVTDKPIPPPDGAGGSQTLTAPMKAPGGG